MVTAEIHGSVPLQSKIAKLPWGRWQLCVIAGLSVFVALLFVWVTTQLYYGDTLILAKIRRRHLLLFASWGKYCPRPWRLYGRHHETNGYHPLWMAIIVAVMAVSSDPVEGGLRVVQVLGFVLLALSFGLIVRRLSFYLPAFLVMAVSSVLFFPRYSSVQISGMEAGLAIVLFLLVLEGLIDQQRHPEARGRDAWFGVLLGSLVLARLDTFFILIAIAGWFIWVGLTGEGPIQVRLIRMVKKLLAVYWPAALLCGGYLAWNVIAFGHPVPISGRLKFAAHIGDGLWHARAYWEYVALLPLAALGVGLGWRQAPELARALAVVLAGSSMHLLHSLLFMDWAVFGWHYALLIPEGVLGLGLVVLWLYDRLPVALVRVGAVILPISMVTLFFWSLMKPETSFRPQAIKAANWARENLPPQTLLAMKDSGAFTFVSRRRTVNLDGIISDMAYQTDLCSGRLVDHLRKIGASYIVQHAIVAKPGYGTVVQEYPCHLPNGSAGYLTFSEADEVFRARFPHQDLWLVIWKAPWASGGGAL